MTLPVYLHSAMQGAPTLTGANGALNTLLHACLVNGFNTQSVASATASGGVATFNFGSAPGFNALDTVSIAGSTGGVADGQWRVQSAASNQVLVAIPGIADGAIGGTITVKFSPLGWTRPYSGTGLGAYRMGGSAAHKRFLRVYDGALTSGSLAGIRGYENMTAISTGTGPFPTTAQVPGNGVGIYCPYASASGPFPWAVVGTPRTVFVLMPFNNAPSTNAFVLGEVAYSTVFGELARIGKPGDLYAQIIQATATFPSGGVYMPRAASGAAGAIATQSVQGPGSAPSVSGYLPYPDTASGGINFADAPAVLEDSVGLRGYLPGVLCPYQTPVGSGVARVGDVLTSVTGVTGRVLLGGSTGANGELTLLLDEDWGDA